MRTRVTLTTDFGTRDSYVAQLKGVLYALGPSELEVVDLTHEIAAQNVREAALFVRAAWPRFPDGTIHLVVVDPGVGSERQALAIQHGAQCWLGPDNGVMSLLFDNDSQPYRLQPARFCAGLVSATFHGRDVFAPAAAQLAHGRALTALGSRIVTADLVQLRWPAPVRSGPVLQGEVIHVDRFGNAISNLTRAELVAFADAAGLGALRVRVGTALGTSVRRVGMVGMVGCYADAPTGAAIALLGSGDVLEVAVVNGHAAELLALEVGTVLQVEVSS